ncbi:MAG: hypothetical protein QM777_21875 [Pseudorhodoferax sp.]
MRARPFATTCHCAPHPGGGNLQVTLNLDPGHDITPDVLLRLRRPFEALEKIGRWGAMSGVGFPPRDSTMALVANGVKAGPHSVRWDFQAIHVDRGTAFVIQNLVHHLHLHVVPVVALAIRSPLVRDGASIDEELPDDYEPCPFTVHDGRESTKVSIDVEFSARMPSSAAEPFREAWDGWYDVCAHGGFASEDYPLEETSIYIEDDLKVVGDGIGGVFDDVVVDDAAFSCLVNMLQTLHHRLTPIATVTIE